jgi:hypothetical protein
MQSRHLAIIFSLILLLGNTVIFAQTEVATITAVNSSSFPVVTFDFQLATPVSNPEAPSSYILSEDGQPVEIESIISVEKRQPISLLIVLDQGRYSVIRYRQDYDLVEIKQLFYTLGKDFLQEGDRVGILTGRRDIETNNRLQTQLYLPLTGDSPAFTQAIDRLDLGLTGNNINPNSVEPIETTTLLEAAIEQMAGEQNGVILFVSALIHAPNEPPPRAANAARRLSNAAQAANLQFAVFQVAANTISADIQESMQALASSNDLYVELKSSGKNLNAAKSVYEAFWQNEISYTVAYRSGSATNQPRTVSLALANAPDQIAQATYTVSPEPPALVNETIRTKDGQYQLAAAIEWPDQMPRQITAVQIDDQAITEFTFVENRLAATFASNAGNFVEVTISDELGLASKAQLTLPDQPMPVPTVPTTEPELVPEPEPDKSPPISSQLLPWLSWLGLLAALGYIVVFQRKQLPKVGRQVQQTARRLTTIVTGNTRQPIIAHLHIEAARDELVGETVNLITDITTLGRDPQLSDIQLYAENERSSISGQHCTIQFDQGQFHIIDNGSANGTAVNGNPLVADNPFPLSDGDEIQLGHKALRGATLRFTIAESIKRKQRATIAEAEFPGSPNAGKPTQTDLESPLSNQHAVVNRLPILEDDETWWKKLE